ncbi:insulinase family protein [Actinospica sp. MGRD01-02]|uniref:Insulinase family protein n=1 Tax=Actinospica acidithermotolerans TaxID=2828514 RepID=A0A941ED18_9ACTN|nr:pitrilysin family protein [Actinospica acidithermotolerans]MBR7829067.1 insulinase family protein [Actinospica acidithermotolerans]
MTSPRLAARPTAAAQRPYAFPEVRKLELAGGRVVAAHLPGQPLAWLGVMLGGGALAEPLPADGAVALDGLSRATASLLDEGTENYTADEFGAAVESLGGRWGVDSGWQSTKVTIDLPVSRAEAGVGLLAEAVRRPAFRDVDTRRFLSDLASAKREQFARPGVRAQQALRNALYGEQARFGRLAGGTPESTAALTGDAVREFHARWLRGPGVLLVAGDLDLLDLEALAAAVFADAATGAPATPDGGAPLAERQRLTIADRPGAVQSTLRIGHPVPTRRELMAAGVDIVALRVASTILGGSFSSRLNHELREVKGYTYGAHSSFDLGRPQGLYSANTEVQTDSTAPAVADALRIINEFFDGGATAAELELTRAYLAGATPIGLQSPGAVGDRLIEMTRHDLPGDYITTEHARLLEVTLDEVNEAVRAVLRPQDLVVAVEGDESAFGTELAKAVREA